MADSQLHQGPWCPHPAALSPCPTKALLSKALTPGFSAGPGGGWPEPESQAIGQSPGEVTPATVCPP